MALFGKNRDINLFHTINNELLKDIIQTEVAYYKFALEQTIANVYGEAMGKNYYEPVKIACLIDRLDQSWSSDDFGSDMNQSVGFKFLKNELKNINLLRSSDRSFMYNMNACTSTFTRRRSTLLETPSLDTRSSVI